MKKISLILMSLILFLSLVACQKKKVETNKKINVVTTVFAEYDWVKEVVGENLANFEITLLQNSGADLHSYQPSVEDLAKIKECDYFIYVGGESDEWVEKALELGGKEKRQVLNLVAELGEKSLNEEVVEGMQHQEHDEEHHEEEEPEKDEHVWLSLRNATIFVQKIAQQLALVDPANKDLYLQNAKNYIEKLVALDRNAEEIVSAAKTKTLLFGDRFPFRYFVNDYGLKYYAAFVGCSAESEASFETIAFLAKKVDEEKIKTILTIENASQKIAKAIIEASQEKNQEIKVLDSLQSVTLKDIENGKTYYQAMEKNIATLKEVLEK